MKKQIIAMLTGAFLMIAASALALPLTLTLSSGADTIVVQDGGAGDMNPFANEIFFSGTINGIKVSNATGASAFSSSLGTFDIGSFILNGTGLITIQLSGDQLSLNTPALIPNMTVTQFLTASYFGGSPVISSDVKVNGVSVPGIAGSISGIAPSLTNGFTTVESTFSLDEIVTLALGNSFTTVSLDSLVTVAPVPEPGTMMLLGFGLLGLAVYGKRRMNKES